MALLNYSTTISAAKTLGEIQGLLAQGGARQISVDYGAGGQPEAVAFTIRTAYGDLYYRLPANAEAVYATLQRQYQQGKVRRGLVDRAQAARVGWRIVKDWLEAQLAIIEAGLVTLDEVFLPYHVPDGAADGRTMYQLYREHQTALPKPGEG